MSLPPKTPKSLEACRYKVRERTELSSKERYRMIAKKRKKTTSKKERSIANHTTHAYSFGGCCCRRINPRTVGKAETRQKDEKREQHRRKSEFQRPMTA
jgi:hypothetical protein